MLLRKHQRGFVAAELVFVVLVLIVIAGVGTAVYQRTQSQKSTINSFETCVAAGNPVMESYPEQCSTDGKTYTRTVNAQSDVQGRDNIRREHAVRLGARLAAQRATGTAITESLTTLNALTQSGEALLDPLANKPYAYAADQENMQPGHATFRLGGTCDTKLVGSEGIGLIRPSSSNNFAVAIKLESNGFACESAF